MVFQLCFVCCQTWKVGWHQRCPRVQSLEENRFRMLPSVKAPLQTSMGQVVRVVVESCRGRLGGVAGPDHLWCCQEGFLPGKHPVGSHCQAQAGAAEVAAQRSFCCLKVSLFWGVLFSSVASQRYNNVLFSIHFVLERGACSNVARSYVCRGITTNVWNALRTSTAPNDRWYLHHW